MRSHRVATPAVVMLAVLVMAGCGSARPVVPDTVAVELHGGDGGNLAFEVSSSFVRELVESALGSSLTCHSDLDPGLGALLRDLDGKGAHAVSIVRRDGDVLRGRRHGQRLDLTVSGSDGDELEVRMPWAVAECLLGRTRTLGEALARGGGRAVLEIHVGGRAGGTFRASLR